ncbi:hypothetical protein [Methylophaga sp.]|uniref:hypothetical protein n=1 Tax=Methylophaga sp. TaxID=2024840 RepID=UPI003A94FD34
MSDKVVHFGLQISDKDVTRLDGGDFLIEKTIGGQKFTVTHDDLEAGKEIMKTMILSNIYQAKGLTITNR